jgi:hypothetical protein
VISPATAARGRALAAILAAGREGVAVEALVLGPDSRRAVGQLIGEGKVLVCGSRLLKRAQAPWGSLSRTPATKKVQL